MPKRYAAKTRTFYWTFDCPVDRIWTVLADTERFNEAAKLPKYAVIESPQPSGAVAFFGKVQIGPYSINWREIPTNWIKNSWWRHERRFSSGPLATLCATLKLYPDGDGCRGEYILTAEPRNIIGWLMLATTFFPSTKRQFDELAEQARQFAVGASAIEFQTPEPKLQPGASELLAAASAAMSQSPYEHGLAPRLVELLSMRPEMDVRRIRPLTLARKWGVEPRAATEICLQASRENLLGMSWDLLCPRCQGAKARSSSLDQLPLTAHCATCNIDYKRDYTKNVEMTFYPNRRVRQFDDREFCLFGPMTTPHIWAQITVEPGASFQAPSSSFGSKQLRLRTLEPGSQVDFDCSGGACADAFFGCDGLKTVPAATAGVVTLTNASNEPHTFVIDEPDWSSDALTADRVMALQAFRDLFDDSILRPGDHLQIDKVTIMFIDLRGSSLLYEQSGDLKAYHLVREFFSIVAGAVRKYQGAIVKTVGDAVNAAFVDPKNALACAIAIQRAFVDYNRASDDPPIVCKIGVHAGRTIAVTLNNRLDYYGTAVNKAARLSDLSNGADIVLSMEIAQEPSVAAMLDGLSTTPDSAKIKGFVEPVSFIRAMMPETSALDQLRAIAAA